jgi:hypothetical protein
MLGFESFASVGGLGRGTATFGVVLGTAVGAVLVVGEGALTVAETVSTASGFSTEAGTAGFGSAEVAAVAFDGVEEAVPEVVGIAAEVGAGGVIVGIAAAVVVANVAGAGQR